MTLECDRRSRPGLIAVLLITRSKPGPKLVFHYPLFPRLPRTSSKPQSDLHDAAHDDSDADSSSDERREAFLLGHSVPATDDSRLAIPERLPGDIYPSDELLGYSKLTLEKLLSPDRYADRKKFQITVNGLTFIGHPVFADSDGKWTKGRSTYFPDPGADWNDHNLDGSKSEAVANDFVPGALDIAAAGPRESGGHIDNKFDHVPDSFDSPVDHSLTTSMQSVSTAAVNVSERLNMFHVVFVIRARKHTVPNELYHHVVRKLSKALLYCQRQTIYVSAQSRILQGFWTRARAEKTDAATLWERMLEISELAWALKEVYQGISAGNVAGIRISGFEMSLQIPLNEDQGANLEPQSALLLLEDRNTLLRNLTHPEASALATFVRENTATKSLEKNARNIGIPIDSVLFMARHLIKWRKARSIEPLHPRDIYVVAPDLPTEKLSTLIGDYAAQFSALPSLPQMLKMLGGKPIKFGSLVPSRDHRAAYMDILAYLVQYRLVARLQTFGWLHLQVQTAVVKSDLDTHMNQNRRPLSVAKLLSPQLHAVDDDSVSVSSQRTAIPLSLNELGRRISSNDPPKPRIDLRERRTEPVTKTVMLDPRRISDEEAHALNQLKDSIEDEEFRTRFDSLLPYLDGEHPLEGIAGLHGLKRSKVEAWLDILHNNGALITFRSL